jgi:hypothetical protein
MMASRRNRARHGLRECEYGCCRPWGYGVTDRNRRRLAHKVLRRREDIAWRNDNNNNDDYYYNGGNS